MWDWWTPMTDWRASPIHRDFACSCGFWNASSGVISGSVSSVICSDLWPFSCCSLVSGSSDLCNLVLKLEPGQRVASIFSLYGNCIDIYIISSLCYDLSSFTVTNTTTWHKHLQIFALSLDGPHLYLIYVFHHKSCRNHGHTKSQ